MGSRLVRTPTLDVGALDHGDPEGPPVVLLHGFPYDVSAYDQVAASLVEGGARVVRPWLRGFGRTRLHAGTPRVGQQTALASDLLALLDGLQLQQALLVGYDWGGRAACLVAAGDPGRVRALVSCGTGYNVQDSATAAQPAAFDAEQRHWYWYYLDSPHGEVALRAERAAFCRYLWRTFSPTWHFDDEAFTRSAAAFDNPDFVDVVLHSYRYRIGAVAGAAAFEAAERAASGSPSIAVPTIVLEGGADAVDPPQPPDRTASHFTDLRRITVLEGTGHNLPQERPQPVVDAVLELLAST